MSDEGRLALREAALALVGWSYVAYAYTLRSPALAHPILCPWRFLTGTPCPLCGTTRSWDALLHGDWRSAFQFHPLAPLLLLPWIVAAAILTVRTFRFLRGLSGVSSVSVERPVEARMPPPERRQR